MSFNAADLAARAASLRSQGVVPTRRGNFKVTARHIGKRAKSVTDDERDRDWWLEYEMQNR